MLGDDFYERLVKLEGKIRELTEPPQVKFKKLRDTAVAPTRAYDTDSGWDIYWDGKVTKICGGQTKVFPCGIAVQMPPGWECQIRPRSSMSRAGCITAFGTVDNAFTGELGVTLSCQASDMDWVPQMIEIHPGYKIAQLVFVRRDPVQLVETLEDLAPTDRGSNGWGSSGK